MQFQKQPVFGFTRKYPGRSRVLTSDISVSLPFDPSTGEPEPEKKLFTCIWDTGATGTVITPNVVTALNLKPTGKGRSYAVGLSGTVNESIVNTYLVNLYLPNRVNMIGVRVSEGSVLGGDVLLGMDIIGLGDFAVTNRDGLTCMSFRFPSVTTIDFVAEINEYKRRHDRTTLPEDEHRRLRNREKRERRRQRGK